MQNPIPYVCPDPLYEPSPVPEKAASYLKPENPRLLELRERYANLQTEALSPSIWDDEHRENQLNLTFFRGDNAYVWQKRDKNLEVNNLLTAYYYLTVDRLNLFDTFKEDNLFGIFTYPFLKDKLVSRDLLDSIGEILFLEETLQLSTREWNILDIGAGYGRLAHRMVEALPKLKGYFCVDAIPESTFLSEFYLDFRSVNHKAKVWCLDEIEQKLKTQKIDLALNIHSFSECTAAAAKYWLELLKAHEVPNLMIVPNPVFEGGEIIYSSELDKSEPDLMPIIQEVGYQPVYQRPKYTDPGVQQHGVTPTWYHLFRLEKSPST